MALSGFTTYLMFETEALEAAQFYVDLFPHSRLGAISHYEDGAQLPAGSVLTVEFEIFGSPFAALNSGQKPEQSEAVSFQVMCDTQDDVDRVWSAIIEGGGTESMCGWCADKWGINWQVIPVALDRALKGLDGYDSAYAFKAMTQMSKIVVEDLAPRTSQPSLAAPEQA